MASVKFEKGSPEWQMFTDFWALCQKYWKPEELDAYWEDVIGATNDFYKKHKSDFAKSLALALLEELERKFKG